MRSNDEIIDLLHNLKEQQNLSISEIARRVGMAKSAVSRYFNRTREFPLNRAESFAKAFGITQEDLLGLNNGKDQKNMSLEISSKNTNNNGTHKSDPLFDVFHQLNKKRKKKVIDYAKFQLDEQNRNLRPIITEEIDTLAAHSKDPDKVYTPEEIDDIKAYLDKLSNEYDKKHK